MGSLETYRILQVDTGSQFVKLDGPGVDQAAEALIVLGNVRANKAFTYCVPLGMPDACRYDGQLLFDVCQVHNANHHGFFAGAALTLDLLDKLQRAWGAQFHAIDVFERVRYVGAWRC